VDERLANFVLNSHLRSHPQFSVELDQMNMTEPEDADVSLNYVGATKNIFFSDF